MAAASLSIADFLDKFSRVVINPILGLAFAIATAVFLYGIFQFIKSEATDKEEGKRKVIYGLIGMFVMFSAYGLIHLILSTFGIQSPQYISL